MMSPPAQSRLSVTEDRGGKLGFADPSVDRLPQALILWVLTPLVASLVCLPDSDLAADLPHLALAE